MKRGKRRRHSEDEGPSFDSLMSAFLSDVPAHKVPEGTCSVKDSRLPDLMRRRLVTVADVEALLSEGADINGVNNIGQSALYQAASRGDGVWLLELLLSRGGDPNLACFDRTTALHCAARLCPQSVALLIDRGARVNAHDV